MFFCCGLGRGNEVLCFVLVGESCVFFLKNNSRKKARKYSISMFFDVFWTNLNCRHNQKKTKEQINKKVYCFIYLFTFARYKIPSFFFFFVVFFVVR